MATVNSPTRVALNKLYPASIYSRPALAPLVVGIGGQVGQAQQNLTGMYKYTLQQMAVSPFSVNSEEYMKRIREEYGYADNGMYDAMGTIGSIVGAGMGFMSGAGIWKGTLTDNFKVYNPKTWFDTTSYQNPITNPFIETDSGKLVPAGSKRQQTSSAFRSNQKGFDAFINKYQDTIDTYDKYVIARKTSSKDLSKYVANNKLDKLNKEYDKLADALNKGEDTKEILKKKGYLLNDIG